MKKVQVRMLAAEMEAQVVHTLMYTGRLAAVKAYKHMTGCRLMDAKEAVDRLARAIQPGPTGYVE
jgi:ribosomal protein L7/L12